nr:DUF2254 domain-containing protein [Aurantimonas sp. VKM B-3413]
MRAKTLLARLKLSFANAVWVVPVTLALLALGAAQALIEVGFTMPSQLSFFLSTGGAAGARDFVQTVATTSLTVATLVFSIAMVVLQLASSQYSPRLPGQFLRSRGTQIIIGIFIFTFVYSLTVVRAIRADESFVPSFAVTVAFVLILCCIVALIVFIHHVVQSIRVESILGYIERKTRKAIGEAFERLDDHEDGDGAEGAESAVEIPEQAEPIVLDKSGIVRRIDGKDLVRFARKRDVVLCLVRTIGEHVAAGTPIGWTWSNGEGSKPPPAEDTRDEFTVAIQLTADRSLEDDVAFGFVQLTDVALRALSPAINDPTTACNAISSLEILLVKLTGFRLGDRRFHDEDGVLRVIVPQPTFTDLLDRVVTPIRQAAPDDITIGVCLCDMLADIARVAATQEQRDAVRTQLERIEQAFKGAAQQSVDVDRLTDAARRVRSALTGQTPRSP